MKEIKRKKAGILFLVLMAALFIVIGFLLAKPTTFVIHAAETDVLTQESETQIQMTQLSELSEEECVKFIIDNGIEIPAEFIGLKRE